MVSLQSIVFFCLRRASQIFPPNVDENTAYSNVQKINQFARYVWITCLRVNEDEDWLDAVLALATSFERLSVTARFLSAAARHRDHQKNAL